MDKRAPLSRKVLVMRPGLTADNSSGTMRQSRAKQRRHDKRARRHESPVPQPNSNHSGALQRHGLGLGRGLGSGSGSSSGFGGSPVASRRRFRDLGAVEAASPSVYAQARQELERSAATDAIHAARRARNRRKAQRTKNMHAEFANLGGSPMRVPQPRVLGQSHSDGDLIRRTHGGNKSPWAGAPDAPAPAHNIFQVDGSPDATSSRAARAKKRVNLRSTWADPASVAHTMVGRITKHVLKRPKEKPAVPQDAGTFLTEVAESDRFGALTLDAPDSLNPGDDVPPSLMPPRFYQVSEWWQQWV